MLHTYETLGWWRKKPEVKRVHFAEELNEYHHLLIMEALGGDEKWLVRFLARHSAVAYFFVMIGLWIYSPTMAYNFSELIEAHAVDTYTEFYESNEEMLTRIPAPQIAKDYYMATDMYVFDEFQTDKMKGTRRPKVETLYDVFKNIADDEQSHVSTMATCQGDRTLDPQTDNLRRIVSDILVVALAIGVAILSSGGALTMDENIIETIATFCAQMADNFASGSLGLESDTDEVVVTFTDWILTTNGRGALGPYFNEIVNFLSKKLRF